jgi:succinate dehydrogenase cytochrome b556 subunit
MKINRPLSPHLTIYKPQLTSTFSIFHRISGAFLGAAVRSLVITTKALLLEGLRAYLIAKERKHATEAAIKEIFVGCWLVYRPAQ